MAKKDDSAERVKALSERNAAEAKKADAVHRAERDEALARAERDRLAVISAPAKVKPDPQGDIDARMAALLKDHQEMGARPK